jgi:P-type Ca2+ transporter type 2C
LPAPDIGAPVQAPEPGSRDTVRIIHRAVPGRVRLHVKGLRHSAGLKARLIRQLSRWGDIHTVWPSTDTGNLLALFDPALPTETVARRVAAVAAGRADDGPDHLTGEIAWHHFELEHVATELGTSLKSGLSSDAAADRLALYGHNSIPAPPGRAALEIMAGQFQSLPVVLLLAAGAMSLMTGGLADAVAILAVVVLNASIGYTVESRSENTIRLLRREASGSATVLRTGKRRTLPADRLVPGDVMLLARGDTVSADARIWRAHDLLADEAILTGESQPVRKHPAALPAGPVALGDRRNMIYRGTVVTSGTGAAIVVATGLRTETGRIQRALATTTRPPTPMERELDKLGRVLSCLSLALGGLVAVTGLFRGLAMSQVLRSSVALAIAAIPEGLPTVASATLARGVELMRRRDVLVRRLDAVETLGAVQVLCFDKTGTLTVNRMAVAAIALAGDRYEKFLADLPPISRDSVMRRLLEVAVLCSEVSIDATDGSLSGSETETALVRLAISLHVDAVALRREQPMLSIRHRSEAYRFMATSHAMADGGTLTAVKGDPLDVLELCEWIADGDLVRELTPFDRDAILAANASMAGRALRVLGFAFRTHAADETTPVASLVWLGLAGLADAVRPEAAELISAVRGAGVHPLVLTGDQVATARAVAGQLGLGGDCAVLQPTLLERMTPAEIADAARQAHVFARVSPADKLRIVQALQDAGVIVGMVGDGFNDSPALKAANVGIAVGHTGPAAARDAADIVLQTDNLLVIGEAIEQGRAAYANVRRATGYLIGTNLSEIGFVFACTGAGVAEPLTAAQLLWINIVSDVLPGVGLSAEPSEPSTMRRPPRTRGETVLGGAEAPRLLTEGGIITAGALASAAWGALRHGAGPASRTMGFGSLVLGQLLHAFNRRAPQEGTGDDNPMFAGALAVSFGVQAVALMLPALRGLLGVVPLAADEVAVTLAGGVLPFFVNRAMRPNHSAAAAGATETSSPSPVRSVASST